MTDSVKAMMKTVDIAIRKMKNYQTDIKRLQVTIAQRDAEIGYLSTQRPTEIHILRNNNSKSVTHSQLNCTGEQAVSPGVENSMNNELRTENDQLRENLKRSENEVVNLKRILKEKLENLDRNQQQIERRQEGIAERREERIVESRVEDELRDQLKVMNQQLIELNGQNQELQNQLVVLQQEIKNSAKMDIIAKLKQQLKDMVIQNAILLNRGDKFQEKIREVKNV